MKKIIFTFLLLLSFVSYVNAESCDTNDIKRLKEIADGVEITYEWLGVRQSEDTILTNNYNLYISGINDEIYIYEKDTTNKYYFDDFNGDQTSNIISGGTKIYSIYSIKCNMQLSKKVIEVPNFNIYSMSDECKGLENKLDICDKWYQKTLTQNDFEKKVKKYNEKNTNFNNLFKKNSLFVVLGTLILLIIIITFFRIRKKGVLE